MKGYPPERTHTIGLFGHSGSGKTTLTEALLLTAHAIARAGRVEDGTTVTDADPDEQRLRHSINLGLAPIEWNGDKISLIDVPGYADFAGDMAAAMRVVDGAVLVLDAAGGVEVGTELAWQAARAAQVPRIIFVNKMDREHADFIRTVEQARERLDEAVVPMQLPIGAEREFAGIISLRRQRAWMIAPSHDGTFIEADIPAEYHAVEQQWRDVLIDRIAATNDDLIEKYLEGGADALTAEELQRGLRSGIANGSIVPVFCGSATQVAGMAQLLNGILDSFPTAARRSVAVHEGGGQRRAIAAEAAGPLAALVFKTLIDPYGKISYVRIFSGTLTGGSTVVNPRTGRDERLGQLYAVRGKELMLVPSLGPGEVGALTKLGDVLTGDTLCSRERVLTLDPIIFPATAHTVLVKPRTRADLDKLGGALHHVVEEDPTLHVSRDAVSGETLLAGLSEPHLQLIAERMKRKFGVDVELDLPRVPYRETIRGKAEAQYRHKKQTGGAGQFADVSLRIEPLPPDPARADPLEFVNAIVGGVIDRAFVPSVEKGVRAAMLEGVATGNQMVDVRVELFDGKMHPVDSKDIAFQIAGQEAFRLAAAKAGPVIMEPIHELVVVIPDAHAGDIMSDLTTRRGRVLGMLPDGEGWTTITAQVPYAEVLRYATDVRSLTQGRGRFSMRFDHFADLPAHLAAALQAGREPRG